MDKAGKKLGEAVAKVAETQPGAAAVMKGAIDMAKRGAQHATKYAAAHPYAAGAVATGTVIACAPVVVTAPGLALAGFGAGGIGAHTAAATVHGWIGNVVGGSVFATLQSAGAAGAGAAAVNGAASMGGAAVAGVTASVAAGGRLWSFVKGRL
ncbi:uncharacterized protein B0H64DRAFT_400586 [Chaetomium fimeti]|uniref:Uncharacterized protein n=1 Tax=Chaetomium fimeti TaxID=1854472 RepID=A0AAE0HDD1_9PEZI|nr:hypothetical protein B0H64DRAFT_400586 [Chaetomium fimeti]